MKKKYIIIIITLIIIMQEKFLRKKKKKKQNHDFCTDIFIFLITDYKHMYNYWGNLSPLYILSAEFSS